MINYEYFFNLKKCIFIKFNFLIYIIIHMEFAFLHNFKIFNFPHTYFKVIIMYSLLF